MSIWCIGAAVVDIVAFPIANGGWDEKQRIEQISMQVGGDAANQCVRLADIGRECSLIAAVGNDQNALLLKAVLQERGVDTSLMATKDHIATGTAMVLVSNEGERHTFSIPGAFNILAKSDLPDLRKTDRLPDAISIASFFSMPELEENGMAEWLQTAHELKIPVIADLLFDQDHKGLAGIAPFLPYIDYFLPSEYDAYQMTGTNTPEAAAAAYQAAGAHNVIIKCGPKGVYAAPENSGCGEYVTAPSVNAVDATGAGDCMVALFTSRISAGDSIVDACRYACTGASLSTLELGACMVPVRHEDIITLMDK